MPDWENVRTFLEVAQCGTFRSAACNLGQSMNALRRRINELEAQLGVTLFTRHVDGLRADAGRIPRVRHVIDWLVECFDLKKFPWFRDEFIHPGEFPKLYRGGALPNHFEGFGVAIATEANPFASASGAAARSPDGGRSGMRGPAKPS